MSGRATSSATRARRLLALLHLLERDGSYPVETIAEMLGASVSEIAEDLDALACCGVAPYYPDQLVPLFVDHGVVEVFGALPALERSVRLSVAEARALTAALQAAGLPADDPLAARLLAAAAPESVDVADLERVVRAAAAPGGGAALAALAAGLHERRAVAIAYQPAGSDEAAARVVEPLALVSERGAWYAEAFCRTAGALRTFRVDRVREARLLDEHFAPRDITASGVSFSPDDLPLARVAFSAGEDFSERDWPGARAGATHEDGSFEVDVPYSGLAWIARQVVARLGSARVVSPPEVREAVALQARTAIETL